MSAPAQDSAPERERPLPWLIGGALATLALIGGVVWITLSARSAQSDQGPIGELPRNVQDVHALTLLADPEVALLGHHDGLLLSADSGRTWRSVAGTGDVLALAQHPSQPNVVYAAGHDVFYRSEDGGRTWAPLQHDLPSGDVHALASAPDGPTALYAIVADGRLFQSSDDDRRWTLVSDRVPGSVTGLAISGSGHRLFYLATADQGVLVSGDGRGWGNASGIGNATLPPGRVAALVFDPKSGDRLTMPGGMTMTGALYAGTDRGLYKTVDGGNTWTRLPLQTGVQALTVSPADSRRLLAIDGRAQVYQSPDRGLAWRGELR